MLVTAGVGAWFARRGRWEPPAKVVLHSHLNGRLIRPSGGCALSLTHPARRLPPHPGQETPSSGGLRGGLGEALREACLAQVDRGQLPGATASKSR